MTKYYVQSCIILFICLSLYLSPYSIDADGVDQEEVERELSEGDGEGGDEDGGQLKQEYVRKEFVAREYVSQYNTEAEVRNTIVKNARYD